MEQQENIRNVSIVAHVDSGKCFKNGTRIRLSHGKTKFVEDLTTEDFVLGIDGEPKKILEIHEGTGQLYEVSQKLGTNYIVNGNHILVLKFTNAEGIFWSEDRRYYKARYIQNMRIHDKCFGHASDEKVTKISKNALFFEATEFLKEKSKEEGYNRGGDIIEISVEDYLKLPTNVKRILYGFKEGVEYPEQEVEIDPYLLGLWLGDGTSSTSEITNIDQPIIDYIYDYAEENNLRITQRKDGVHYRISNNGQKGGNSFLNALHDYGLINNKHIPHEYLQNTREIRLQVLAGLIDTDGYKDKNIYEIVQKSDYLSRNIRELCASLGFRVSCKKRQKNCHKPDGTKVAGWYNCILISGTHLAEVPVLLERKKVNPICKDNFLITQITVTKHSVGKYTGFQIEGDGRFFGTDFSVLHNSSLTDSLVCRAGLISEKDAGEKRWTDNRPDEQARGITIKSTGVSMQYDFEGSTYHVNLIDSPGHIDFSHEVTAALRISDGCIVVLDAVEGVCVQTETVLRQALAEQVKPILYINKMDRLIFELQLSSEEMYQKIVKIIDDVNNVISIYKSEGSGLNLDLSPDIGNVYFGSAYHAWGFGLKHFAKMYAKKFGSDENKLMKQLWGEQYFDPETKKITSTGITADGKNLPRTFCKFILDPILDLIKTIHDKDVPKYTEMFTKLGIKMSNSDLARPEKEIYKMAMRRFLPLADAMIDGIINHLPSPQQAQQYRYTTLYDGPLDDECATAIKNCDENGPLMVYVSKMIPTEDGSRFYAFGRVFSGTAQAGQKVRIMGSKYRPGNSDDYYENKSIQRVVRMIGGKAENCDYIKCGNTIALVGVDQYILKSGTITTSPNACPIKTMKFSVAPIVQVAVSPKDASDLPKFVEGLKKLSKSDPSVQCFLNESGDHIIAGVGELHLEICLNDLKQFMKSDIKVSQPIVPLRETILNKSNQVCLAKSPNGHNRLYMTAEPLHGELVDDMENKVITMRDDPNKRAKILVEKYNWDVTESKKIWAFGPEGNEETNVVVDCTKGVQYLNEIKDHTQEGFKMAVTKGILCGEPVRGVKFNIQDVVLHADAVHRGGGQIAPAARKVMIAAMLTSMPAIMEPIFTIEVQVPQNHIGVIYNCLQNKRGEVFSQEQSVGELCIIKGTLPVLESFHINELLREQTSGQASTQLSFSHWKIVDGDPLDTNSVAGKIVAAARKRKGLPEEIPALGNFLDKL